MNVDLARYRHAEPTCSALPGNHTNVERGRIRSRATITVNKNLLQFRG